MHGLNDYVKSSELNCNCNQVFKMNKWLLNITLSSKNLLTDFSDTLLGLNIKALGELTWTFYCHEDSKLMIGKHCDNANLTLG